MKSIPENEGLNQQILSQILTEEIYIITETTHVHQNISHKKEVEEVKKTTTEKITEPEPIISTAKSDKKTLITKDIVIVLDKPANTTELEFLTKILAALKMTMQDVSIIALPEFSSTMNFKKLISFNVSIAKLNPEIKTEKYSIQENGKAKFLSSDSLDELTKDVKKKKQLWDALQQMFALK